jgi:hypothetical protein
VAVRSHSSAESADVEADIAEVLHIQLVAFPMEARIAEMAASCQIQKSVGIADAVAAVHSCSSVEDDLE